MKKKIWILTHHASPPQYETRIRNNAMAKYLMLAGYDVTIFGASTIHNTDINLIKDGSLFIERQYEDLHYIHVNAPMYKGNGIKRKLNLVVYPFNLYRAIKQLSEKPDVIINDLDITAFDFPFKIGNYVDAPLITEVRDLWPESLIVYGYLKRDSLLARFLYETEKKMYMKSHRIVYTMEGWPDYIEERGWNSIIDNSKTFHINNGLDLEIFNINRDANPFVDQDLSRNDVFNVVYTGSIRKVNNLGKLLDIAKCVQLPHIRFLVWGDGDELPQLKERIGNENIQNVIFKGRVEKKYVPSIVSQANLNFAHNTATELFRFGISFNKIFDYFAAGKPILCDFPCRYNPVVQSGSGISIDSGDPMEIARTIEDFSKLDKQTYDSYCDMALKAAENYDFSFLTKKMIKIIESFS